MTTLSAPSVAPLVLQDNTGSLSDAALGNSQHRIDLVSRWRLDNGARVLEIGCGQGDATVVLAAAIGESGHVTAVDPGPLDYGSPTTLGEAQAHITNGPLGSRITFVQADPLSFLHTETANVAQPYDAAVLVHSSWYFSSPSLLQRTLLALSTRAKRIYIAEYALSTANVGPCAVPHLLAAHAIGTLAALKPEGSASYNIRSLLSPSQITALALSAGLRLEREETFAPAAGLGDGRWEAGFVLGPKFAKDLEEGVQDERQKSIVYAARDAVHAAVDGVKISGEKLATMDVWAGVFISPEWV